MSNNLPTTETEFDTNLNRLGSLLQGLGITANVDAGSIESGVFGSNSATTGVEFGVNPSTKNSFIQSRNFVSGNTGWQILSDGTIRAYSVTLVGSITATTGQIGGWSINATSIYTGTEDHSGYAANAGDLTIYSDGTDASIHAKNWYIDTAGNFYAIGGTLDGTSTIGGRLASVLNTAIDSSGHFADSAISTATSTIITPFTFGVSGALQIGTYVNGVSGDLKLSPSGILARSSAGATTFSIDGTTGVAVLNGLVVGTNVGLGTAKQVFTATPTTPYYVGDLWSAGSGGDLKVCITQRLTGAYNAADWGLASKYTDDSGVTTIIGNTVTTGFVNALSVVAGSVAAENITGTYITGLTIRTAASGARVQLDNSNYLQAYDASYLRVKLDTDSLTFYDDGGVDRGTIYGISTGIGITGDIDAGSVSLTCYNITLNDAAGAAISVTWNNSVDIGTTSYRFKDLYLGGNLYVSGNVDGVDVSAFKTAYDSHISSASAHPEIRNLSLISIDVSKDWGNYGITNLNYLDLVADGYIKRATTNYVRLTSTYFDMYKPVGIFVAASDQTNYQGGLFFSSGTGRFRGNDTGGASWRDICFYDERNVASPIPTFISGLEQLKQIKSPVILEKEGLAFDTDAFPKEFCMELGEKKEKHTNLLPVIGMLIQSQKELLEKVEKLETK